MIIEEMAHNRRDIFHFFKSHWPLIDMIHIVLNFYFKLTFNVDFMA